MLNGYILKKYMIKGQKHERKALSKYCGMSIRSLIVFLQIRYMKRKDMTLHLLQVP